MLITLGLKLWSPHRVHQMLTASTMKKGNGMYVQAVRVLGGVGVWPDSKGRIQVNKIGQDRVSRFDMLQGSVWSRLGAEVTLVEFLGNIGGFGIDLEVAKMLQRSLAKQGLKFLLQTKVVGAAKQGSNIKVSIEDMKKGKQDEVTLRNTRLFLS